MSKRRVLAFSLALGASALLAVPALAAARGAYVTGSGISSYAAPVDLATGVFGDEVPIATEGPPQDVAITPDAKTAYVSGAFEGIVPIDVGSNTAGTAIPTGVQSCPTSLAIKPDGTRLYAVDPCEGGVSVIDVAAGAELADIALPGSFPRGIAITPNGAGAFVSDDAGDAVIPVDLNANTAGAPLPVGDAPRGIAVTPDGTRAYVVLLGDDAVRRIDIAGDALGPSTTIPVGDQPEEIAISPDSARAYVTSSQSFVTPLDLDAGTAGAAIEFPGEYLGDVSVMPDGSRAWITDTEPGDRLLPIGIPGNAVGAEIPALGRPDAIAIVPNQGPTAAFTSTPNPVLRGDTVSFNGTGSTDSDGTVARYEWDFGDGTVVTNGGATPSHTYSFGGTYTVTLTVTDNEGCSLAQVFPGQTMQCNGGPAARTIHQVQVTPKCIDVNGSASTFVPKYRPARVAPGLRVRLAASSPAKLTVHPLLIWGKGGRRAELPTLTTTVQQWRRVRFVIPADLRDRLPLGKRVRLHLRIEAAPLDETLCGGQATERTLRLRVVKVIPGVVQHGRVP